MPSSLIDMAGFKVSAEDFLGAVLETAAQPIWVVDPEGLIRFANPAAIAALGYDEADELFGRNSHETIHYRHPDGTPYPAADCPMLLPRSTGERVSSDLDWFFRRDGSMFAVSYLSVPIEMPQGRGAVVAFTDIDGPHARRTVAARARGGARRATGVAPARRNARGRRSRLRGGVRPPSPRRSASVIGLPLIVVWRYEPDARGDRARGLERAAAALPGRYSLADRRPDGHRPRPRDRPPGEDRRLRTTCPGRSPTPPARPESTRAPAPRSSSTATSGA